jgi:AraC family transcriptional activator of pobA
MKTGHFRIFKIEQLLTGTEKKLLIPPLYETRYQIGLIIGCNKSTCTEKNLGIRKNALLFATPETTYNWKQFFDPQSGYFCAFSHDFLIRGGSSLSLEDLPIFNAGKFPIFFLSDKEAEDIRFIVKKIYGNLSSDYAFKYDLLRNYVLELIHYGQKLQLTNASLSGNP